jgi:hypothetical protein
VGAGGVTVAEDATAALVDAVLIDGAAGHGITILAGAEATVSRSSVREAAGQGISATDARAVKIASTRIEGAGDRGLSVSCTGGCDCATPAEVTVENVAVTSGTTVGARFYGVTAEVTGLDVESTRQEGFGTAAGLVASCATLERASAIRVLGTEDVDAYGIIIYFSTANIGGEAEEQSVRIEKNYVGLWIENPPDAGERAVRVERAVLASNRGVGIGLGGETRGIIIYFSEIRNTAIEAMPVMLDANATVADVADGLVWNTGASAQVDRLTLSGNLRSSILVDGPVGAGSKLSNVTLEDGDEEKGLVHQRLAAGDASLDTDGSVSVTEDAAQLFAVPTTLQIPSEE